MIDPMPLFAPLRLTPIRSALAATALCAAVAGAPLMQSAVAQTAARAAPARATAPALTGDLLRVQQHLSAMSSLTSDFSQTDRNDQVQSGRLTLKQPGRIRFQYAPGIPLLIVADGSSLTMIDYEVRQVQRWPIGNSPLGALLDPSRDLSKFGKVVPTGDPTILSVQARDPKRPEYGTITLIFRRNAASPAGLQLYGWVALDSQNNRTAVRLTNQVYGAPIADSAFRWTDPRPRGRSSGG